MVVRIAIVLAIVAAVVSPAACDTAPAETIRVGLYYGPGAPQSVTISGVGRGEGERSRGDFDGAVVLSARGGEIVLDHAGAQASVGRRVELEPAGGDLWLEVEGRSYRGRIRVEVAAGDRLCVVNIVDIEDYVRGVVPNEMFSGAEAYKVQAVISRTYAVYVRDLERKHHPDGFDICTTGHCQVYAGVDSERPLSDEAVAATRGEVLTYRGRPIFSAYHSNAGGLTQTVDEAWPGSIRANFPYLAPVESPYDAEAQRVRGVEWCYRWQRRVAAAEIAERLRTSGRDIGEVRDLVARDAIAGGHTKSLEVVGCSGRALLRTPAEIRAVLGTPSARFDIRKDAGSFDLTGWGYGHGVGLSQHGALGMSRAGHSYDEILGHFYQSVELAADYGRGLSRPLTRPQLRPAISDAGPLPLPSGAGAG